MQSVLVQLVARPTTISWTRQSETAAPEATQPVLSGIQPAGTQPAGVSQQAGTGSPHKPLYSRAKSASIARKPQLTAQDAYLQRLQEAAAAWYHASHAAADQHRPDALARLASEAKCSDSLSKVQGNASSVIHLQEQVSQQAKVASDMHLAGSRASRDDKAYLYSLVAAADRWKQTAMRPESETGSSDTQMGEATSLPLGMTYEGQKLHVQPESGRHPDVGPVQCEEAWSVQNANMDTDRHTSSQDTANVVCDHAQTSWIQGDHDEPAPAPPPPPLTTVKQMNVQGPARKQKASWLAALRGEAPTWAL